MRIANNRGIKFVFYFLFSLLINGSTLFAEIYPLYIPQNENITYANPDYLVENALQLRITDYPDSAETLPSLQYPQTIQEDGCMFLQNTLFNLFTGQNCSNSCGVMCTSSCSGGCGQSCGGPIKWLAAQMVEGMYLAGSTDLGTYVDCQLLAQYRVKVRGCSDGWYNETNCGNPADCVGISFVNTGLRLNNSNPGGFPGGYDPALYTTIDLYNFEIDMNAWGRIYGNWVGCGCVWYRPWCCAGEAACEAIDISTTLMDRQATSDPVDEKAILKAYTQDSGNGQTKVGFQIPWSQTTLNNFNVNIFQWSCSILGWDPCAALANWLNGVISNWIRPYVENAVDDAVRNELGQGFEYILDIPPNGTNPFDIVTAPSVQGGLDFVSDQLRMGLEGDLKETLVTAFEGFEFTENNYHVTDLAGCGVYADFDVIVRGCYDASGNIKPLNAPPVGCYWLSDGLTQLHPGGDPGDLDGLSYQRTGVSLTSDPTGFTPVENGLYTTLQLYDLELDVDAYFTVRFQPGNPYCNWVGNYFFPQRTGLVNATAKGVAQTIFDGTSVALNFTGFQLNVNDLYIAAVNWSCCAPSQTNCQWDVCRNISQAANLFLSSYAVTLLGDMINQEIESLLNGFFDKDGDGNPDPLFDLNDLLAGLPLGEIGLRIGLAMNLNTSPSPPLGVTLNVNAGLFPVSSHPCVPYARTQGVLSTPSPPPQFGDNVPGLSVPYMLGVEISDDFVNQALYSLYSAGFLCIDIDPESRGFISLAGKPINEFLASLGFSGDVIPEDITSIAGTFLNTNAFAFFLPELWEYAPDSPIKIVLRPNKPPVVSFGVNGDTLRISLEDFNIDLYTRMDGREIRALSFRTGASLGFTLNSITLMSTDPDAKLIDITVGEPEITTALTFNEIIPVKKDDIEAVIVNILRLAAPVLSGFAEGLKPLLTPPGIDPDKPEGDLFGLTIPQTYVVTDVPSQDGSYFNYLGIFLNLGGNLCWSCLLEGFSFSLPPLSPAPLTVSQVLPAPAVILPEGRSGLKPQATQINTLTITKPEGIILLSPPDGYNFEYSYRIDNGLWSNYSHEPSIHLKQLLEGNHIVEVRGRDRNGDLSGINRLLLRVDSLPPIVSVKKTFTNNIKIEVKDLQTPESSILTSWKFDDGEWSEPSAERTISTDSLPAGIHTLSIKATDNAGNEAIFNTTVEVNELTGCGCSTGEGKEGNIYSFIILLFCLFTVKLLNIRKHPSLS